MQDITIRNVSLADAPRILEIYAWYVEHTVITFEYDVPSLEEFEGRMRRTMQKYPYLVIERAGRVEGYAYAGPFVGRAAYDWACELTIYLDHDARKHGMGRALYEALADRLQATGGNFAKMFDIQNKKFVTISCCNCGYTELYRQTGGEGWDLLDFLSGH